MRALGSQYPGPQSVVVVAHGDIPYARLAVSCYWVCTIPVNYVYVTILTLLPVRIIRTVKKIDRYKNDKMYVHTIPVPRTRYRT